MLAYLTVRELVIVVLVTLLKQVLGIFPELPLPFAPVTIDLGCQERDQFRLVKLRPF